MTSNDRLTGIIDVVEQFASRPAQIEADTELLSSGLIDSLRFFHIIAELESQFGVRIGAMDATADDFRSPRAISDMLDRVSSA